MSRQRLAAGHVACSMPSSNRPFRRESMSSRPFVSLLVASLAVAGCQENTIVGSPGSIASPTNFHYQLDPSGDPDRPAGILLRWNDVQDPALASYRIYSRASTGGSYGLRGETSSNSFHDNGIPHLPYFVTAVEANGGESDPSNTI